MIQRIQTVYLFLVVLAAVYIIIPIQNLPLAKFYSEVASIHFFASKTQSLIPGVPLEISPFFNWPFILVLVLIILTALMSILQYKNRASQMRSIQINIVLSLIMLGGFFFGYVPYLEDTYAATAIYTINSFVPALILLLLVLAYYGVRKDDKLVKSMDRIR